MIRIYPISWNYHSERSSVFWVFLALFLSGCFEPMDDIVVLSSPVSVTKTGIELELTPPLQRTRKNGSLLVTLDDEWAEESPWQSITLADGEKVKIVFTLLADTGEKYRSTILGGAYGPEGKRLNVRFEPPVPLEVKLIRLEIKADRPMVLNKIVWHNFNPL